MASVKITVDRLQPGLHIRLPVKWNDHPFLFNSFKIKSEDQIKMIRHLGIEHVFINLNQSDTKPLPPNTEPSIEGVNKGDKQEMDAETKRLWEEKQERIEKLNAYRRRVINCEKEFERSLSQMRAVMNKIRSRPEKAIDEATALVSEIVDKLMSDDHVTLHLINSKSEFEDVYFHSLNVSVIAMMIGKAKGMSSEQLKELSFASLFHDIGKLKVPTTIVRKQVALTDPEKNYLKLHTKYGVELANNMDTFPDSAKKVIAQHHELSDGSGYPEGLKESEIDELSQIVSLANAYDNLCHPNIPSEQKIPYVALSHLYKNCKKHYNSDNLNLLIKFMGVYPPGTVVQLSNQMVGLVISVNSKAILFPNVLIYDPSVPRTQAPIIELEDKDIKIVNAILPNKLPDKVKEYLNPRSRISYFFDSDD
ncbi:HD-GYP domain-containing protein [Vibrio marisflavi]|uniref:Cyclic di-GMP phosphodiesterase n=1 Tax=Vibrio marisflavi CECT 7928 TaxID=634439 RepID=A0ABN8E6W6_9VIBR|nr:HD-GYP domain-containing protein [Vibrio marisflavi]CAH0541463.1 Cyclic di-GMP phosphodiesterase [Vibrio marisflavi CECT 7928]